MRVLLVEPQYRRLGTQLDDDLVLNDEPATAPVACVAPGARNDDVLWYPPLGLMKLARFHKQRDDEVVFVSGCNRKVAMPKRGTREGRPWDRVYITTLFTFHWDSIVDTIAFYKHAVGGTAGKVFVGGIMASLMPDDLFEETGIYPVTGILNSPSQIGLPGAENIDSLAPDYTILDQSHYAINDTYYAYTSRGCVNKCGWCGVPRIEPQYQDYIDIKPAILQLRAEFGDKSRLRLMDNNVLASTRLRDIVADLEELGYGRGQIIPGSRPKKQRIIDFNQGLDATYLTSERMELLQRLNIRPMRIAFDRAGERASYTKALQIAKSHGVEEFSNYMLYNWRDTPKDLYERLIVNIELNEAWGKGAESGADAEIYSYPMRFAPINNDEGNNANRRRDAAPSHAAKGRNWLKDAVWTPRFIRNVEIMKGAAHGCISPTPSLARRTIGATYEEFLANLYMPEELLRNRNRHEKHVYAFEPQRAPGTGRVEAFRAFILKLLRANDARFQQFHNAVSVNSKDHVRYAAAQCKDKEIAEWLQTYLNK